MLQSRLGKQAFQDINFPYLVMHKKGEEFEVAIPRSKAGISSFKNDEYNWWYASDKLGCNPA